MKKKLYYQIIIEHGEVMFYGKFTLDKPVVLPKGAVLRELEMILFE